ncbi:Modification methylase DpnIIA [Listeria ivanovii subsp. londoniensis]|uniref:site-specific DNA-methyltransferase (adenine-specific) n=2 Tax=Listeria ivanovii TaxID=1638 RepID=A0ABS1G201_LISIV|nr:DNA adenine methylase [Listeria ivanovii]EFR98492.1 DNA-methyltransferase [Listeria ivanovii FSL F6-596]AIS58574.1 DNA methyltransferase [Listeria ivanovii subsp. londoniensis]MBK1960902.1 DNA adenine methylase [Listeria ivanovii subsp. londoniensis]MBK2003220.1 DNA adenine methylase [Listeria ivanovii subsp. londoniensis]SDW06266.1 DNA adenine methylase [Listeria ivanovii]
MNPSPLRYPGGKYKLYKYLKELVSANGSTTYIEPFGGGSAISLALLIEGAVNRIIINDFDYTIYCFWNSVINDTDNFIKMIEDTEVNINEWRRQKEIRNNIDYFSELEIGFSTFFLNRTNRSGIIDKAGPIGGVEQTGNYKIDCRFNKPALINKIRIIEKYKKHIILKNMEAIDFINDEILLTRNSFTFFDPPYYKKGPGLYKNFYQHGDHLNLANEIQNVMKNRRWIVTYDSTNEIKEMYEANSGMEFNLQYTLQNKRAGKEVMFFSKKTKVVLKPEQYLSVTAYL